MFQKRIAEGIKFLDKSKFAEAELCFKNALKIKNNDKEPYLLLGELFIKQSKFDQAINHLQKALELNPQDIFSNYLMGLALDKINQGAQAIFFYQQSYNLGNRDPLLLDRLGSLYLEKHAYLEAYQYLSELLQNKGDESGLHARLAIVTHKLGYSIQAKQHCFKAYSLNPSSRESLLSAIFLCHKDLSMTANDIANNAKFFYQKFLANTENLFNHNSRFDTRKSKLKLGFVSADFCRHPVAHYLIPIIENLDLKIFDIVFYYNGNRQDEYTKFFINNSSNFRFIQDLSDKAVANLIRQDDIDILLDLSGLTCGERLGIFALKPAPLQISQTGYFGTLAMPEIDYILGDEYGLTKEEKISFTEKIYTMEGSSAHCAIPNLPDCIQELPCSKNNFITFGSLNTLHKINDEVIEAWSKILLLVPNSRILIDSLGLEQPSTKKFFLSKFTKHNINSERVILQSTQDRESFLKNYNNIDLALDPFPYTGSTTSMEALMMGVPVITQEGNRWISRFTYSILKNLKLDELIANNLDAYINKAAELAKDKDRLKQYRLELRRKITNSPFNIQAYTQKYSKALQDMWISKCKSLGV